MKLRPQEIDMLFSGAMQNYIFNFAFESRNPGCEFDIDSWVEALEDVMGTNELNIMNKETQEKMEKVLNNLDAFAKKKEIQS